MEKPEELSIRDIVLHIQEYLLHMETGIFIDGEAILMVIEGLQDFCVENGATLLEFGGE